MKTLCLSISCEAGGQAAWTGVTREKSAISALPKVPIHRCRVPALAANDHATHPQLSHFAAN